MFYDFFDQAVTSLHTVWKEVTKKISDTAYSAYHFLLTSFLQSSFIKPIRSLPIEVNIEPPPKQPITPPTPGVPEETKMISTATVFEYQLGDGHQKLELSRQYAGVENILRFGKGITRDMLRFEMEGTFLQGALKITIKGEAGASVIIPECRNYRFTGAYWLDRIVVNGESFLMEPLRDALDKGQQPWMEQPPSTPAPPTPLTPRLVEPAVVPIDPHTATLMKIIGAHKYKWDKNGQKERTLTYSFNKYSNLQLGEYLKAHYTNVYVSESKDNLEDYKNLEIFSADDLLKETVRKILGDLQKKIGLEFEEREDLQGGEATTDLRFFTYDCPQGDIRTYTPGLTCMLSEDNTKNSIVMIRKGYSYDRPLVSHEIGHALGLTHSSGNSEDNFLTVMQPVIYAPELTEIDIAVLKENYGADVAHSTVLPDAKPKANSENGYKKVAGKNGNDLYLVNGSATILDTDGEDTLELFNSFGMTHEDLWLNQTAHRDLRISFRNDSDRMVTVQGYFDNPTQKIEHIVMGKARLSHNDIHNLVSAMATMQPFSDSAAMAANPLLFAAMNQWNTAIAIN